MGETEAGLSNCFRRMDGCRVPAALRFIGIRDDKKPSEVVRET